MATDGWLQRHMAHIDSSAGEPGTRVLELGCGPGDDAAWLAERGYEVVACDLDAPSLERARATVGTRALLRVDHRSALPFRDEAFDAVVASLTLHYFRWDVTVRAFSEIRRVLRPGGVLVFRVNASDDVEYGALDGDEVEPGLRGYERKGFGYDEGQLKRFFTEPDVRACLDGFEVETLEHREVTRWSKPKQTWETRARRG